METRLGRLLRPLYVDTKKSSFDVKNARHLTSRVLLISLFTSAILRARASISSRKSLKGSELRCQNFDLVKFREIIPRNPCYGTFFSRNFESKFSKSSDPPAGPPEISEKLYFLDLGICIS